MEHMLPYAILVQNSAKWQVASGRVLRSRICTRRIPQVCRSPGLRPARTLSCFRRKRWKSSG
jgi:hypothetical protein